MLLDLEAEEDLGPDYEQSGLTDEAIAEFDEEIKMASEGRWEDLDLDPPEAPSAIDGIAAFLADG